MKSFTKAEITLHRAVDDSDPGFSIKGFKLRWISQGVEVRRAGRMWRPLHLSSLPKETIEKFKEINPSWANGDTIRRRDLTLSYAPMSEVKAYRQRAKELQNANEAIFKGKSQTGAMKSEGSMVKEEWSAEKFK